MTDDLKPLSINHQAVQDEYFQCWEKTESYKRIYAKASHNAARTSAARLFADANFQAHLQQRLTENHMGADEVLRRLADIARGDIADLMEFTTLGSTISLTNTDAEGTLTPKPQTKIIRKIRQKTTTYLAKSESGEDREVHETELELYSAKEALELIGKHHKLFNEPGTKENPLHIEGLEKYLDKVYGSNPTG